MKITARAFSKDMRHTHLVLESNLDPKRIGAAEDGISFEVLRSKKLSLSGYYRMTFHLSQAEVEELHRSATTKALERRVSDLEKEIKSLREAKPSK